ncbi:carbamoyltransferase HypF [Ktedonosporobacter rubrisoli]|uniref:Carbamoyltransferase n=1 Tax=Ktedonosporobacter rubrisoli TaxID=2509675 RepID=A0A4P6K3K1_KTERU|nr:carbamoyltransferase HypF [Ktedonosporobacter rubrisoli]QBD82542.1 carbamoyltransferase HypF [Ktedonosporobacter rubrisoli]
MTSINASTIQRRRLIVKGIVQGVGFRPFIYGQALHLGLHGFVLNDSNGVTIEIEGPVNCLNDFLHTLQTAPPPLARIDSVRASEVPLRHETDFVIAQSQSRSERNALISPDMATCDDCLRELFDTGDRRYRYPFINCTNCGPRFTIVKDIPYDRDKTTMHIFPMCSHCQGEYNNPLDRRFHAQPNACAICGPQAEFVLWDAPPLEDTHNLNRTAKQDPLISAAWYLANGAILAIKGLGGYHLACDASNEQAVARLRQRKHREARPFALMVPDLATARQLCFVSEQEETLLTSRRRPIVLLKQLQDCPIAPEVAPAYNTLGIMLPYTPLHHLLLQTFATIQTTGQIPALVMTSGNLSDEPITYQDHDAYERLSHIAQGTLTHNREIHMRCDDSVLRIAAGEKQFFRRSRGYVPEPLTLNFELPVPLLACGGHLKNTFCLGKGRQIFISQHIGNLENLETLNSFCQSIEHFKRLFDIQPMAIAYDLHPEYLATKYALDAAIPERISVQHHHAHIASVLAEHGLSGPAIGIAADGTGYGLDGAIWGCEIMLADLIHFKRQAHLSYMPLPGGEQAVHQPWRMAAAYLFAAYGDAFLELDIPFVHQLDRVKWPLLSKMMAHKLNCPQTSSLGRLFDAIAALLNQRQEVCYEGQAAIELEMLADEGSQPTIYPALISPGEQAPNTLDVSPMIRAIVGELERGKEVSHIALSFHYSLAELLVRACCSAREQSGLNLVALSGGVFQNSLLLKLLMRRLEQMGFQVYINREVPPNDGGLSFGQAAIAAARLSRQDTQIW